MLLVDANVLVYATNTSAQHHEAARAWLLEELNSGTEVVGMPWVSLLGFIRVCTHPRILENPLTAEQAMSVVNAWLSHPRVVTPEPSARHGALLAGLLVKAGTAGNLTNDAHLAALALELNATMVTFDRDFGRFDVRFLVPGS
ncbi:PIN domain-containing protein [Cutibacterium equinum]|uniref:Ribonuclease VapC n=1 Tax=Cutibacterium equinum TaxID=3016342 RepID=A0ABY7QZA9_9ACTN|nr:TA system VapC family ribonuclease toxin [Cutibacterium equinum]WCC80377.1 PIN domain-containing protein [Cutibacterium equinum]